MTSSNGHVISKNTVLVGSKEIDGALLEKVIIHNDLSSLSPLEKCSYIKNMCEDLGLNYKTKPIRIISFKGKEIPYFEKNATEQLRRNHSVSIHKIETKMHEGGLYVVTAYALLPNGREDSGTGVVSISGLKGEDLANAMMKAETKAKRRVTLSICGLGFLDESEVDSMPGARKIEISKKEPLKIKQEIIDAIEIDEEEVEDLKLDLISHIYDIENAQNTDDLQNIFNICKKKFKSHADLMSTLIEAKDKKKRSLSTNESLYNNETGEIAS